MTSPELERAKRSLARERKARKELELIAESRARELYEANLKLASALEDLTAQKKRLEELSVSPIFSVDTNGLVDDWNTAAARLTGFCRDEIIGRDFVAELVLEDQRESLRAVLDDALAGKQSTGFELQLRTKQGDTVDVMLNYSTRRDSNDAVIGMLAVGQDITELRNTQAQVIQASKLATLGEMATSVAHELNQPLNVIRLTAQNSQRFVTLAASAVVPLSPGVPAPCAGAHHRGRGRAPGRSPRGPAPRTGPPRPRRTPLGSWRIRTCTRRC